MRLSLCMIVKNEAFFLEECLASAAAHVDEIVIVDTGSTDRTVEIARKFTQHILNFTWADDFSAARNAGLASASGDWVLVLDADERIAAKDYGRLRQAMENDAVDGYYLTQYNYSDNQLQAGWKPAAQMEGESRSFTGYTENPIMRLFRACPNIRYGGIIHEIVDESVEAAARGVLDVPIHHFIEGNPQRSREERAARYLTLMERALEDGPDGRLYGLAGATAMYALADYAKARDYLQRAAELGYEPMRSLEYAAEAAYRGGDIGQAQDIYRSLYHKGHRTPTLCLNMANLAVRSGDRVVGVSLLEECLSLGGMGPDTDVTIRKNIEFLTDS